MRRTSHAVEFAARLYRTNEQHVPARRESITRKSWRAEIHYIYHHMSVLRRCGVPSGRRAEWT